MISAKVIADSISTTSKTRLTSIVLVIPRIVLAELNTHRALSRNSSSSRAIPFKKMVEQVRTNLFTPIGFQKHHSGMQGTEYLTGRRDKVARKVWKLSSRLAILMATLLYKVGVTKQLCNRLLEPFLYHTVIITATEWENFIALRAHKQAEIHIQEAAYCILSALNTSQPRILNPGEWHIPFGDRIHEIKVLSIIDNYNQLEEVEQEKLLQQTKVKIATARCARVSYNNFEGKDDYEADIKLHDMLLSAGHMSPFEHCAKSPEQTEFIPLSNLRGFIQYRKMLSEENRRDHRLLNRV